MMTHWQLTFLTDLILQNFQVHGEFLGSLTEGVHFLLQTLSLETKLMNYPLNSTNRLTVSST